ncbi:MAG: amidohydrolase family protein, partial [Gammaproteobacteria bacterium]|nr:amidohydrolase family protein [Gammaproteobacteria bacterium]
VAPGFIDLHAHGQTNAANEYQAHDGVTTALELESGVYPLTHWLDSRRDNALVNYGATASHSAARAQAMQKYALKLTELKRLLAQKGDREDASDALDEFLRTEFAASVYDSLSSSEIPRMNLALQRELEAGALGVGLLVGYQPGATREEIFGLFKFAGEIQAPIFVHVRDPGIPGIQEVIANAAVTGAPLHIVHVNSMALGDIALAIDLVEAAQARGHDITTELYPYTAGSTSLESALFDEGWQQRLGNIGYADIQWQDTGERLTADSFERYREKGGVVIIHMMREEWIDAGIARESVMIASDGMPYAPGAHPRSAGTFSRVLGRYVRERGALNLMSALQKMTLMPADRLSDIAPAMRLKGRLQVGADADITIFDAGRIIDTATFEADLSFSRGVEYVLVNGTLVVDAGQSVANVFPGRAIIGKYKR